MINYFTGSSRGAYAIPTFPPKSHRPPAAPAFVRRRGERVFTSARRRGYSLIEAVVALSLTVLASSVLALTIDSSLQTSEDGYRQLIAEGLAEQLLDEILGRRYMAAGGDPHQYPLTASAAELSATGRTQFDDIDDYNRYDARPIEDRWTQPLGSEDDRGGLRHPAFRFPAERMLAWRSQVSVYYVDDVQLELRLPAAQTSYHRAVEVSVLYQDSGSSEWRVVSRLRRVVAYIPQSS